MENEVIDNAEIPEYRPGNESTDHNPDGGNGLEDQARALGWKPEEEFKGDASKWTDAETFLQVHTQNNGALRKELAELRKQMQGMDAAHKRIFDMQIKKQKEEHDQQVAFLRAQKREALRAGEHETAADIDEQIDTLREKGPDLPDVPQTTQAAQTQDWRKNPDMVSWASRNPWFEKDEDMSAYAGAIGMRIRAESPEMAFPDLLDEVTSRVRKAFPQKFSAGRRSPVEGTTPGATSSSTSGKSYASLPRDAKAACDEAVAEGGLTQKQWVELYYGYDDRRKR